MPNLRFSIGDLVQLDGHPARVIAPAGFNGPDWLELEMLDEFALIPDDGQPGGYFKTSQAFAPDSSLKPITDTAAPEVVSGEVYVVDRHGIIYGPAISRARAEQRIASKSGWKIIPQEDVAALLACAIPVAEVH
ncbi:hypothetical protein [Paraburkholderia sp.]|uniref:hypothetical protein n=1 Tax=Paraburkholderia sp. TaxID=1926495 RepID=UPI002F409F0C